MLKQWVKRKKRGTTKEEDKPRWEADYELVENEGLFQEYLEMSEYPFHLLFNETLGTECPRDKRPFIQNTRGT